VAAVDCGGGVSALLGGEAFGFGEGVGQLAAYAGELGLEGGDAVGVALPEGSLPFGGCLRPFA
jgi:hypothetical protein